MCLICALHKDVDVVLSVLSCMHLWLQVLPHCQSSCVVNWSVYVRWPHMAETCSMIGEEVSFKKEICEINDILMQQDA
jgi:hypothetical protein